jgi:hypothetical protein
MKQRYKIYAADEQMADVWATPDGMQAWLDWVVKTKWWRDRTKIKHVKVNYPSPGKMSGAVKDGPHLARIDFGPFSLTQLTACHELAHVLTWDAEADPEGDHGPRFAGMFLAVCHRYISAQFSRKLAAAFDAKGVSYSAWE